MLRLSVSIFLGKEIYREDKDAISKRAVVNDFIRELIGEGRFPPLNAVGIDSGHFIYKLLCKLRYQDFKQRSSRIMVYRVRGLTTPTILTEKEKKVQHALGLLNEYDILIRCYDPADFDIM